MARLDGRVFTALLRTQVNNRGEPNFPANLLDCCNSTVDDLLALQTLNDRPGMLLGRIQSGKTRAFLAVIAIGFDNGFDVAIVFTKGTRALTRQTVARLNRDYRFAIEADDVRVYDIRSLPDNLTEWELDRKIVIVCKKEDDNLRDLFDALTDTYDVLSTRRILVIDDEADFASVGYRRTQRGLEANVIPTQMDDLRQQLAAASFLQVTATPYALYLQPEDVQIPANNRLFRPIRPAFTRVLPDQPGYVGGEVYFEESQQPGSVASHLYVEVQGNELDVLKRNDRRGFRIEECLTSRAITALRQSIVTFIVGSIVRRLQQCANGDMPKRYSYLFHTEVGRGAHNWQAQVVTTLVDCLRDAANDNIAVIRPLIDQAVSDLQVSVVAAGFQFPSVSDIVEEFPDALRAVMVTTVNSERQIDELLDESGQLQLRTPYNIFIGGQILDRGLTIDNVIGFYYGRNPRRSQQDTVLQHARMYGYRAQGDLAVTRFYTTWPIYQRLDMIHQFDAALRTALTTAGPDHGVVFLRRDDTNQIVPCSPNRILLSQVTSLRANGRLIPVGFSTNRQAISAVTRIDEILRQASPDQNAVTFILSVDQAAEVVDLVAASLDMDAGQEFDFVAFRDALRFLVQGNSATPEEGQVLCLVRRQRQDRKVRADGRLQNAPESTADQQLVAVQRGSRPSLLLYREEGRREEGWGGVPFYWPVLLAPGNIQSVIFATETV